MTDDASDDLRRMRDRLVDDLITAMEAPHERRRTHAERFGKSLDAYVDARIKRATPAEGAEAGRQDAARYRPS